MDDAISARLEQISELSVDDLSGIKEQIVSEFETLNKDDRTRESVDRMEVLAEYMSAIRSEETRREDEAKELETLAAKAADVIKEDADTVDDDSTDEEPAEEDTEAATKEPKDGEVVEIPADEETPEAETKVEVNVEDAPAADEEIVEVPEDVTEVVADEEVPAEDAEDSAEDSDEDKDEEDKKEEEDKDVNTEFAAEDSEDSEEKPAADEDQEEAELSIETTDVESEDKVNTEFSAPSENEPVGSDSVTVKTPTIVAAADVRGFNSGAVIPNMRALAQGIMDRRKGMDRTYGGDGEQALVASIKTDDWYGTSRDLSSHDTEGNAHKVEAVVAALQGRGDEALVAAGGLYGPVETSWNIYELGETLGRPVKDSLPAFKADRGGLRFITPPTLADVDGAVSVWTLQDDIEAANPGSDKVKPCIRVEAGAEVTVYLEAQPLCLTFGNLGARAYPELVERHIALAMVQQARFAEGRILTRIGALSTQVTAAKQLGAARDILVQVDTAAAGIRNRNRLDEEAPLRAIFPAWFKRALRADLVKQIPGDGPDSAFSLADATIDKWFSERKVNVTWALDGESTQYIGAQDAGALKQFPANVIWYLFAEGTFLFLEEANLDLGIVRDSTLNATNDYKMFVETFENVAKVGVESLRISSELAIAGASAGTVDTLA